MRQVQEDKLGLGGDSLEPQFEVESVCKDGRGVRQRGCRTEMRAAPQIFRLVLPTYGVVHCRLLTGAFLIHFTGVDTLPLW